LRYSQWLLDYIASLEPSPIDQPSSTFGIAGRGGVDDLLQLMEIGFDGRKVADAPPLPDSALGRQLVGIQHAMQRLNERWFSRERSRSSAYRQAVGQMQETSLLLQQKLKLKLKQIMMEERSSNAKVSVYFSRPPPPSISSSHTLPRITVPLPPSPYLSTTP
jgi:hypothetical protein